MKKRADVSGLACKVMTRWVCPQCGNETQVDMCYVATNGNPYCTNKLLVDNERMECGCEMVLDENY